MEDMGRYVPPEHEGTISANKLVGKHALGARARKSGQGILTVRFEMPFPIWCTTCPKPTIIGQGVRFNAEKKKVGNYYSTPILSFGFKHVTCGGAIEIRTDPKNTAYVVTEGAKKRDLGEDKVHEGEIRIKTEEERERIANDAFAALEGKVEDKRQAVNDKSRIEELHHAKERDWEDPGEANRRLRRTFRAERKARQKTEGLTEDLKDRMSLGMDLLDETEDDRRRAGFVEFGGLGEEGAIVKAQSRSLFANIQTTRQPLTKRLKMAKTSSGADRRKENLRSELRKELENNTRAVLDPFLKVEKPNLPASSSVFPAKRKRASTQSTEEDLASHEVLTHDRPSPLVDYDSD